MQFERESAMRFWTSGFFHESVSTKPLSIPFGLFRGFRQFAEIFAAQNARRVWLTPVQMKKSSIRKVLNILLGHSSGIWVNIKIIFSSSLISLYGVKSLILSPLFATGVIDTSGKFTAGVIDTGGKLPKVDNLLRFINLWQAQFLPLSSPIRWERPTTRNRSTAQSWAYHLRILMPMDICLTLYCVTPRLGTWSRLASSISPRNENYISVFQQTKKFSSKFTHVET